MSFKDLFCKIDYAYCKYGCNMYGNKNTMFMHEHYCTFGMVYDQSGFPLYREEQEIPF